jgi:plasmid stabilization system protein ParE
VTEYRLNAAPRVDLDVAAAYQWYETEQAELGAQFLAELDASYNRIVDGPFKYQDLGFGIRRALLRRLPYAVYFAIESDVIAVLAVLHVSRDPAEWQRLRR